MFAVTVFTRTFVMIDDKEDGISVEGIGAGIMEVVQDENVTVSVKRSDNGTKLIVR